MDGSHSFAAWSRAACDCITKMPTVLQTSKAGLAVRNRTDVPINCGKGVWRARPFAERTDAHINCARTLIIRVAARDKSIASCGAARKGKVDARKSRPVQFLRRRRYQVTETTPAATSFKMRGAASRSTSTQIVSEVQVFIRAAPTRTPKASRPPNLNTRSSIAYGDSLQHVSARPSRHYQQCLPD